jgi:hypothetical protein
MSRRVGFNPPKATAAAKTHALSNKSFLLLFFKKEALLSQP